MEDGFNSGWRNFGRFALAGIPWVLGCGALVWFSLYIGCVTWKTQNEQEQRRDNRVGASSPPAASVVFEYQSKGCIHASRGFLDGDSGTVYLENSCDRKISDIDYSVKAYAPDGTMINSKRNYLSGDDDMQPQEKREQSFDLEHGKRTVRIVFRVDGFNDFPQ